MLLWSQSTLSRDVGDGFGANAHAVCGASVSNATVSVSCAAFPMETRNTVRVSFFERWTGRTTLRWTLVAPETSCSGHCAGNHLAWGLAVSAKASSVKAGAQRAACTSKTSRPGAREPQPKAWQPPDIEGALLLNPEAKTLREHIGSTLHGAKMDCPSVAWRNHSLTEAEVLAEGAQHGGL